MTRKLLYLAVLATLFFTSFANSHESENKGHGDRERHSGPPQVLIDACAGIAEGDACSIVGRRGQERQGTCALIQDDTMVCKIKRKVPQVAIDACAGIAEGDACSVVGRRGQEFQGTCGVTRDDTFACKIKRADRKGRRGAQRGAEVQL